MPEVHRVVARLGSLRRLPHRVAAGRHAAVRAWEIKKAMERALSMHRDPNPAFPTVDYDGRVVRYTSDPDAVVDVTP